MHSSGMHTACLLTNHILACTVQEGCIPTCTGLGVVYPSMHWVRGVCIPACSGQGVPAQGVSAQEVSAHGGVCPLGCLPTGVSAQSVCGVCLGGVCAGGGVCPGVWQTPSVDRMTDRCKNMTLPQLRCGR